MQGVSSVEGTLFIFGVFYPVKNLGGNTMKKLLTMLLCLAMTLVCTGILAACDGSGGGLFHQHSADTWEYDETEHWQVCADCGEIFNRGAHIDDGSALCSTCTYPVHPTEGLELASIFEHSNEDSSFFLPPYLPPNGYYVDGIGSATNETELVIPAFHNGLPVVGIYNSALNDNAALRSIFLPNTIEVIGDGAFSGCSSLESITLPNSIKCIGSQAFLDCTALERITLQDNIEYIGEGAFENTAYYNNPNNWEQPNGEVLYIGNHLIEARGDTDNYDPAPTPACRTGTPLIEARGVTGEYTVREGTVTISTGAFYRCEGLTGITIPDGVKTIGDRAFEYCSALADISIPDSVNYIGYDVFYDTAYCTDENNWEDGALYIGNHLIDVDNDFAGSFTVRDGTVTIATGGGYGSGSNAFARCDSLASVTLPDSIKSIGPGAFYGCTSLKEINIPNSVTEIGNEAFASCEALESITIPDSVITIGMGAFGSCDALESITIPDSVTSPLLGTFYGCELLKTVVIGNNVPYIGNQSFVNCYSLSNITIESDIVFIGNSAFSNCSSLKSITIPDSVEAISRWAFHNCTSLTSITIPDGVTEIGDEVFDGCTSLASITIPDSVTKIGGRAFEGCASLASITIPDGVTEIGGGAFYFCTSLTSAIFENPNGWSYESNIPSIKIPIPAETLSDPATAAELLLDLSHFTFKYDRPDPQ